ncbi:MAG TPA: hypothetical protein VGP87_09975 [Gemmatimonadales bacterium]|nr:hypothetical protein [Gemmatimonadales bacterium]
MNPVRVLLLSPLFFAVPLAAQDARLDARLAPETAREIRLLLDSARAASLPTEPLIQKALEGQSKNAPPPRIIGAVRLLLGALRDARLALSEAASEPELVAGANALRAGAAPATVSALRRQRGRDLTVPLSVLTDLVARGVTPVAASKAVSAMVDDGLADRDFLLLRTQVEQDIRTGVAPGSALDRRLSGLPAAAPPRKP